MGLGSIGLLAAAYVFGKEVNGARGWILGIQPAEFVKIFVIILLARFFCKETRDGYAGFSRFRTYIVCCWFDHVYYFKAK